jgi:ankyrin repeat protein
LIQAIAANDAFRVGALISENPELVSARDDQGRTPILLALYFGHQDLSRLIRERTPDPDFFELCALGETENVRAALDDAPAAVSYVAEDGFGPLGLAVYFGRIDTASLLLESGADPNTPAANQFKVRPIHSAAAHRDPPTSVRLAKLLLEAGADPNVVQAGGWTPLHQAAAHGRSDLAKLLLGHGAALDAISEDGRTPLEMARVKGHTELESLLGGEGE